MIYTRLGQTNFRVSKICLGTLTMGPLQANLSIREGAKVIQVALDAGINFLDTAELYDTYPYIKKALKNYQGEVFIATKSYAYTKEGAQKSVEKARREMNRDVIEIFLLHEQESHLTLKGHWEALEYLWTARDQGLIGGVGISTHRIAGVTAATEIKEIDVIHPMLNFRGLGIMDGSREDMLAAILKAHQAGKGIYAMKAIGGGNFIGQAKEALSWAFQQKSVDAVAIGMKSLAEIRINTAWLLEEKPQPKDLNKVATTPRRLLIEKWCQGCGECINVCSQNALFMDQGQAQVKREACVLCGYCARVCKDFCIKVI